MSNWDDRIKGSLGFGCMRLPMDGEELDYAQINDMVDAFMAAGFNYFDTARPYLGGKSETALRKCLVERYPRDSFYLVNKLSTHNFNTEDEIDGVLESLLESLGVDCLDLLLMHAQNEAWYERYQRMHAYEHSMDFVRAGKARHFGISFHDSPEVLERILADHPEIEVVQIQFNYADWDNPAVQSKAVYDVCAAHGISCIVMEPVKGGNLVDLPPKAQEFVDSLPNPEGLDNAGIVLRFAASMPNNRMVLSGMSTREQMDASIASMRDARPLAPEMMAGLTQVQQIFKELGMIECTACHYCTAGCPKKIMIPEVLGCLNSVRVFGGWNPGWYYTNTLITGGHGKAADCIACGKCEKECPQKLPIRDLLAAASAEFDA